MTRRQLLGLIAAQGTTALLTACHGTATTPSKPVSSSGLNSQAMTAAPAATVTLGMPATITQHGSKVTVVYWDAFGGERGKLVQEIVQRFHAAQSDVEVVYQFQGSYDDTGQKLLQAIAAKQTPDLVLLADNWWFRFYLNDVLQPLSSFFAQAGIDLQDYVGPLLNEGTRHGEVYWVPFARSTPIFYYNKTAWQEAGLPDRGPETWEEFAEWAPKLVQQRGGNVSRSAFALPTGAGNTPGNLTSLISWLFQPIVWQWGGRYSDEALGIHIQEAPAIAAGQSFLLRPLSEGWAILSGDIDAAFLNGGTAAVMQTTANLANYERNAPFPVGTAKLPKGPAGFGCCTGGSGLAILKGKPVEVQQAAFRYIAFATSPEITAFWSQNTGYMPVRRSAVEGTLMTQFYQQRPNFRTAVEQLPQARPCDPAREWIPNGFDIIGRGLERVLTQREDPVGVFPTLGQQLTEAASSIIAQLKQREGDTTQRIRIL